MRTTSALVLLTLMTVPLATPLAAAYHQPADRVTAIVELPSAVAGLLVDAEGATPVSVRIFRNLGGWQQVALGSTLRGCWFDAAAQGEVCPLSIGFRSSASGATTVTIPAGSLPVGSPVDLFVTFSDLGGATSTPTSHYNPVRNALLGQRQFALAEELDYHGATRIVAA